MLNPTASAPSGALTFSRNSAPKAQILYKPGLKVQHLPACQCGSPHPLAHQPPIYLDSCPDCGAQLAPLPKAQVVEAVWTTRDPQIRLGSALIRLANWLLSLKQRLSQ